MKIILRGLSISVVQHHLVAPGGSGPARVNVQYSRSLAKAGGDYQKPFFDGFWFILPCSSEKA